MIAWRNILGLPEAIEQAGLACCQRDNEWFVAPYAETVQVFIDAYEPPPTIQKRMGVEFEGVVCSATAKDQAGLTAVLMAIQVQRQDFTPTRFHFENDNTLVIHLGNYQAFMTSWMPFRQSFSEVV